MNPESVANGPAEKAAGDALETVDGHGAIVVASEKGSRRSAKGVFQAVRWKAGVDFTLR